MDYGYSNTSYNAGGAANGGGFMTGSQGGGEGSAQKRGYGKDTLRPVTIKQLLDAHHPHPDADHFVVDDAEMTQVTFVGQVRNISTQTTNVTYKIDDGTGSIEVKVWIDAEALEGEKKSGMPVEQGYARVWGRLKAFNNKRHVGAINVRHVQDYNEISYHLLEATVVHLHFTRGPPEQQTNGGAAAGGMSGQQQQNGYSAGGGGDLSGCSASARKFFACLKSTPQTNEGLHAQDLAGRCNLELSEVLKAADELLNLGKVYTTVDDSTWAILDI
ncbi:related to single-stranded DNA binding protein 30K chain [Ramularia collo-cygni]|uniref:Related to single-stranded DNA binding protein 30K chain n=1 Tax=Ramularia collo-cygni TaxID=112498 RepID=A0A2D3V5N1_9PEZI|nr:related to single-stranded DNA binding protein 30K chain [Ramularia collo-cygni]CZT20760.1 related to single-stranded DNA binding protein 30K chain [Ramularia collo-cygni]